MNLAIDYIVQHLHEPLRLRSIARAAKLSPFHFQRIFQALMGETPAEFTRRLRLEKALGRMALPKPPSLTSIALSCGFASLSDFSRAFKDRFGVPPRRFDIDEWRAARAGALDEVVRKAIHPHLDRLPPPRNPDRFSVRIRDIPARTVAYIRVDRPYEGTAVIDAAQRLMRWADDRALGKNQWLGYQWENPEVTALEDCRYYVAVEGSRFEPAGEIGRYRFPPMIVAEIEIRGALDLELRALQWYYGVWLPRSGYVPDNQPGFEAWIGRPFAHGMSHFEVRLQMPLRRA